MERITLQQYGRWLSADIQTPISLYLGFVGRRQGILLESAEVDGRLGRYSLIAWDFKLKLTLERGLLCVEAEDPRLAPLEALTGSEYLSGMRQVLDSLEILAPDFKDKLPPLTRGLYGYMGYGLSGVFEPKLEQALPPSEAETCMVLPGKMVLFDHLRHRCCYVSLDDGPPPEMDRSQLTVSKMDAPVLGEPRTLVSQEDYCASVARARDLITQGEGIQVVLSTRFSASIDGDPFVIYRRLRQLNPSPFMFFMRLPAVTMLGSSPELLVQSIDGRIEVRPIAGTRTRGETEAEDLFNEQELLADPKERAEHVMLVDLGRNDLGRMAEKGSVQVKKFMQVERFSHVMHLTSYVEADLKPGLDALDVLVSAFPAGTVSGAPKIWAMQTISELETMPRGPYAGSIGWMGLGSEKRNLATGITIRSLWVRGGKCLWQAGAGIVYDSVPEKEWQECRNKARVLQQALYAREDSDVFADR